MVGECANGVPALEQEGEGIQGKVGVMGTHFSSKRLGGDTGSASNREPHSRCLTYLSHFMHRTAERETEVEMKVEVAIAREGGRRREEGGRRRKRKGEDKERSEEGRGGEEGDGEGDGEEEEEEEVEGKREEREEGFWKMH